MSVILVLSPSVVPAEILVCRNRSCIGGATRVFWPSNSGLEGTLNKWIR